MGSFVLQSQPDERDREEFDEARAQERQADADLVARVRSDDSDAFGLLYDRWFARVNDLAFRITRDEAAAADVAQDAFLRAWQKLSTLEDPLAFGGWLLRITRNRALDRQRRENRSMVVDDVGLSVIELTGSGAALAPAGFDVEERAGAVADPALIAEDNELSTLLWESASALGERDQEILDLGLRHGMTPADIGEIVGMSRNASNQAVHRARGRLKEAIEARVLWRRGEPVCVELAQTLDNNGIKSFGAPALVSITDHAAKCEECQKRRSLHLDPSKMFGAVPFVGVAWTLRAQTAHALSSAGVPMDGSVAMASRDPDRPRRFRSRRTIAFVAGGVVITVVLSALVFSGEVGDSRLLESGRESTPVTAVTKVPRIISGIIPGITTPTTRVRTPLAPAPVEAGTATISVSPDRGNFPTFVAPTLTWLSSSGARVEVAGNGISSAAASGSVAVCPGKAGSKCEVDAVGSFIYRITVYGTSNQVLAEATTAFTVE